MRGFSVSACVLLCLVLAAVGVSAQSPGGNSAARKMKNPVPATDTSIAAGAATYKKYCAFCHNTDGKGEGPLAPKDTHPANLVDADWVRGSTDGEIFVVIQEGAGPKFDMKGFKGKMPDADMWNVINFLRSLGPKKR